MLSTGGSLITATGTVYSVTTINANPILAESGVITISSPSPNTGTGLFANGSGAALAPNVQYSYNAYATKSTGPTGYGTATTFYTLAVTPTAPIVGTATGSSLNIAIGPDANPSATTYAILETTTGSYVQANGTLGATAVYQTANVWGTIAITGLSAATTYAFEASAKNGSGVSTAAGPSANGTTLLRSNSSDIVFNSNSSTSTNSNLPYTLYQGTTLTNTGTGSSGSIGVMGFYLRDGGPGLNDVDNLATELTDISFTVANGSSIRSARLFVGNASKGASIPVVNGVITFTGLSGILANDNTQLAVNLRVTFNSSVTDNEQLQFTISSATAKSTGSSFALADAGGASSSLAGDINRIEVTATKLAFQQQPPTGLYAGIVIIPAPTVVARDVLENRDLDYSDIITLTTSGNLTIPLTTAAVGGLATFTYYVMDSFPIGINNTLTASANNVEAAISTSFEVMADLNSVPTSIDVPTCSTSNDCNLVANGDFEEYSQIPTNGSQLGNACGWYAASLSPDYFHSNSPNISYQIPCNHFGIQTSNGGVGNGYAGLAYMGADNNIISETMVARLYSPLVAGQSYQLSFDVSLAENWSYFSKTVQAYLSPSLITVPPNGPITTSNDEMFFSKTMTSTVSNGWETLTFTFTSTYGGEEYIYLGGLKNIINQPNTATIDPSCIYGTGQGLSNASFYYIDNVRLMPLSNASLDLPVVICNTQNLSDLSSFLSNVPLDGVFTGIGVSENEGIYSFNAASASVGNHTITYSYNVAGCDMTISDVITIVGSPIVPEFTFITNTVLCENSTPPVLPTTSDNGIPGSWSPTTVSTAFADDYIFTPDPVECATQVSYSVSIVPAQVFVTADDNFSIYLGSTLTTGSLLTNDTFNNNAVSTVPASVIYSITPVGPPPTFTSGGITFNGDGTFTVSPNTPVGVYVYTYEITSICGASNQSAVTITIRNYVSTSGKIEFRYCFNNDGSTAYNSSDSVSGYTSLYDLVTVLGVPASASNTTIQLVTPPTVPLTINADGTFTIASSISTNALPSGEYSFYYKVCSNSTSFCSQNIRCDITIENSVHALPDAVTFLMVNGPADINVLTNDIKWDCFVPNPPTSMNVEITQTISSGNFVIQPSGTLLDNPAAAPGVYYQEYKICDSDFPLNCSTTYVWVYKCDATADWGPGNPCYLGRDSSLPSKNIDLNVVTISPNPSKAVFEIIFELAFPQDTSYTLYDLLGKRILGGTVPKGAKNCFVNLETYTEGIYLLQMRTGDTVINKKLVKI